MSLNKLMYMRVAGAETILSSLAPHEFRMTGVPAIVRISFAGSDTHATSMEVLRI